jgi:hypothetical protein
MSSQNPRKPSVLQPDLFEQLDMTIVVDHSLHCFEHVEYPSNPRLALLLIPLSRDAGTSIAVGMIPGLTDPDTVI